MDKHPLKVFLADRGPVLQGDDMRGLPEGTHLTQDSVDRYAWFDKAKLHGERSRTILPGQNRELEIRTAVVV